MRSRISTRWRSRRSTRGFAPRRRWVPIVLDGFDFNYDLPSKSTLSHVRVKVNHKGWRVSFGALPRRKVCCFPGAARCGRYLERFLGVCLFKVEIRTVAEGG